MSKSAKKRTKSQDLPAPRQQTLKLTEFVRRNLMSFIVHEGMRALDELLEQERQELCGPPWGMSRRVLIIAAGHPPLEDKPAFRVLQLLGLNLTTWAWCNSRSSVTAPP